MNDDFWEQMKICKCMRYDGKDGKCIDVNKHNHGCVNCDVANGLYEPDVYVEELQPCPFCGEEALAAYNTMHKWQVFCSNVECFMNEVIMDGIRDIGNSN